MLKVPLGNTLRKSFVRNLLPSLYFLPLPAAVGRVRVPIGTRSFSESVLFVGYCVPCISLGQRMLAAERRGCHAFPTLELIVTFTKSPSV